MKYTGPECACHNMHRVVREEFSKCMAWTERQEVAMYKCGKEPMCTTPTNLPRKSGAGKVGENLGILIGMGLLTTKSRKALMIMGTIATMTIAFSARVEARLVSSWEDEIRLNRYCYKNGAGSESNHSTFVLGIVAFWISTVVCRGEQDMLWRAAMGSLMWSRNVIALGIAALWTSTRICKRRQGILWRITLGLVMLFPRNVQGDYEVGPLERGAVTRYKELGTLARQGNVDVEFLYGEVYSLARDLDTKFMTLNQDNMEGKITKIDLANMTDAISNAEDKVKENLETTEKKIQGVLAWIERHHKRNNLSMNDIVENLEGHRDVIQEILGKLEYGNHKHGNASVELKSHNETLELHAGKLDFLRGLIQTPVSLTLQDLLYLSMFAWYIGFFTIMSIYTMKWKREKSRREMYRLVWYYSSIYFLCMCKPL